MTSPGMGSLYPHSPAPVYGLVEFINEFNDMNPKLCRKRPFGFPVTPDRLQPPQCSLETRLKAGRGLRRFSRLPATVSLLSHTAAPLSS